MFLAIFPLQLVLFPGEEIPLHIFEPRYKQLIIECRDADGSFGIPAYLQGNVSQYGSEVELIRILQTHDTGEMDIVVRATRVFKIEELIVEVPGKLYSGARVAFLEQDPAFDSATRNHLLALFHRYLELTDTSGDALTAPDAVLSFHIARDVGLSLPQRVSLLSMTHEGKRQAYLVTHLKALISSIENREKPSSQAGGNGKLRHHGD